MAHLATMLEGVHWQKNGDEFQKTLAINDFYLAGGARAVSARPDPVAGPDPPVMAKVTGDTWRYKGIEMRHIPLWAYDAVGVARDRLAGDDRRPAGSGQPRASDRRTAASCWTYRPNNMRAHAQLVEELREILQRLGYWSPKSFAHSAGAKNTTHQCGTLVFGTDPRASVLDPFCRTHDVENLFVVDASFFPSSAAVNPGLTIAAQALRVADHIKESL